MILALDTSGDEMVVVLVAGGELVGAATRSGPRHQVHIMAAIAEVVGDQLPHVDAVAVARGPGSHTGLRVGLSTAAGLAFGRRLKVYPLSSLAVAAHRAGDAGDSRVLALVGAGRGRAYSQEFARRGAEVSPKGARLLVLISEIAPRDAVVAAEPALMARLSVDLRLRSGPEAMVAAVNQAVGREEAVNYDQLTGDYGD